MVKRDYQPTLRIHQVAEGRLWLMNVHLMLVIAETVNKVGDYMLIHVSG